MQWFVAVKNNTLIRIIQGGVLGMLVLAGLQQPVLAVNTEIGVSVCGQNTTGASISITQPNDDSIVNQSVTTFRGTINNTSQITIEIDGTYVSTLAIGSNQTTFATDISLDQGTHTIAMTANDICGVNDGTDSIVITYQPITEPSNGATTPTDVDEEEPTPDSAADQTVDENTIAQEIEQLPVIGGAVSMVADFITTSGLEATVPVGNVAVGVSRVGLTVAALTSVVMASTLAPVAAQAIPGLSESFSVSSHRSMLYLGWIIRGAGVVAMAFAYFL